jgi:hypothetical protein
MNKEIIEAVSKRQFKEMMEAEKELKRLLSADTGGRPQEAQKGIFIRIEGILTNMVRCQDRIMLLQQLTEESEKPKSE